MISLEVSQYCLLMGHMRIVFGETLAELKANTYIRKGWLEV